MKDVQIVLNGNNGVFTTNNTLIIFRKYITTNEMKDSLKAIRSKVKKMLKAGDVSIDIMEMVNYNRSDKVRLIVRRWGFKAEYRPITVFGDFSDVTEHTFENERQQLGYIMRNIESLIMEIIPDMPENKSFYAQELDQKYPSTTNCSE